MKPIPQLSISTKDLGNLPKFFLTLSVIGIILCVILAFVNPAIFCRSYLVGFLFWFNMAFGSLFWLMVLCLSGGHWAVISRRIFEAGSRTIFWFLFLFIPILFGMYGLYDWMHPDIVAHDHVIAQKVAYLNSTGFYIRLVFYFVVWGFFSWRLSSWSSRQDETGDPKLRGKMAVLSGPGIVILFLTMTFAAIDWVLSLEPHYSSTMYGVAVMAGQALGTMAMAIAMLVILMRFTPMKNIITPGHLHDLGKLMLAATMFWAYVNFSQFLITWGGNLATEIPYYLRRTSGGWGWVGAMLIAFHFFVPFGLLLNRDLKRHPESLLPVAYWIIALRFADICFLVLPSKYRNSFHGHMELMPILIAAASVVAIGGLWCWLFFRYLVSKPLMPVNDPYLKEALEFRGGH